MNEEISFKREKKKCIFELKLIPSMGNLSPRYVRVSEYWLFQFFSR